jgi:hypothetical protein
LSSSAVVIVLKILSEWPCCRQQKPQKPRVEKVNLGDIDRMRPEIEEAKLALRQTLSKT